MFLVLIALWCMIEVSNSISAFSTTSNARIEYPESIMLRGGVLHAPPFAVVEEDGSYSGFQIDLIERLKEFAWGKDRVQLNVSLTVAPSQYGPALDLVANDCNTTANPNPLDDCQAFDFIVGNYYATSSRSSRVDLSPAWLQSTISTIKSADDDCSGITTLAQASRARATVCIKRGTFYSGLVMEKYPNADYLFCPSHVECVESLKNQECVLYPDDEFQLRYRQIMDTSVRMTKESFNTQYIVWPISFDLDKKTSLLLKRWLYLAINNGTLDELDFNYFERRECPFGSAGKDCQLYCHPENGKSNVDGVCVCHSAKWTGDDCSVEVPEDHNHIPQSLKNVCYCMMGINILVVAFCANWLYLQRSTPQVRVLEPSFLSLVLLGCLISSTTIGFLAYEDDGHYGSRYSDIACMAIPWTYSIGFSITFGTLFAKILRVYRILRSASDVAPTTVPVRDTFLVTFMVLVLDLAILLCWTVFDHLQWKREVISEDIFGTPLSSVGYCISDHWKSFSGIMGAWHLCLLGVASYLCYATRKVPTELSQGRYVSIAMVSNLQIFIVGVPVIITVASDPKASFFIRCVIVWLNDLMVVLVIFGNLIYFVKIKTNGQQLQTTTANFGIQSAQQAVVENEMQAITRSFHLNNLNMNEPPATQRSLRSIASSASSLQTSDRGDKRMLQKVSEVSKESESREMSGNFSRDMPKDFSRDTTFKESSREFSVEPASKEFKLGLNTNSKNNSNLTKLSKVPETPTVDFDKVVEEISTTALSSASSSSTPKPLAENNKSCEELEDKKLLPSSIKHEKK